MNKQKQYEKLITDYIKNQKYKILREPSGKLPYKFIVPGACYSHQLWDWDSWFTDVAISNSLETDEEKQIFSEYQKGCILNFLENMYDNGSIPFMTSAEETFCESEGGESNGAKPVIVQHALFVCKFINDFSWLENEYQKLKKFLAFYESNCKHESGLYFFIDDWAIGVDNDPCTFYRPKRSSASIYLNCLMYKELLAMAEIADKLNQKEDVEYYSNLANELKVAINDKCYDERNGFYYSVDIDLLPIDNSHWIHMGCPRHWNTLIRKIDVWSGFLAMWAGIATPEQADRMVKENYLKPNIFYSDYGIRTLSKSEQMYLIKESGNPSDWLGPIWGISNYLTFRALLKYGYDDLAKEMAEKNVTLFGRDVEKCGEFHEYYDPETGEGISNQGFQSWNLLVGNMISYLNGKPYTEE